VVIDFLFFTHLLNGLLMVGMPIGLAIYLSKRFNLGWRLWWIGAATFVLSQVGHIPFNSLLTQLFQKGILPTLPSSWIPYFNPVVLGLSAGLFEELTRTAVYGWWARDARSWKKGILMGAGHGGVEAIILGALVLYTFLQMAALRTADLAAILPSNQVALAQQQVNAYWSTTWTASLLGAVERFFTIPIQIALSVIVLQAFIRRQPAWILLAIGWHALVDAISVYLVNIWSGLAWSAYAIEGVIGILSIISVVFLFTLRKSEPETEPLANIQVQQPVPMEAIQPVKPEEEITSDALDKSRYTR
jgi:uncharacterized membrane protein YhfC